MCDIQTISKVTAKLVAEETTWKTDKPLTNFQTDLDTEKVEAVFSNIKVNVSTRMSAVQLQFSIQVTSLCSDAL